MGNAINFQIGADKKVYVNSVPSFGYNLSGANGKSQLIFGNSDGSAAEMNVDLSGMTAGANVNLVVGAGASVTLTKDVKTGAPTWTNNGAMTVKVATVAGGITNNGALYLAKANAVGDAYSVTNNAGGSVTVKGGNGVYVNALDNKAEDEEDDLPEGVVRVEAEAILNVASLTNNGTIENKGTFAPANGEANAGTIDNYGVLKVAASGAFTNANGGTIIARDGGKSNGETLTNNGTIEVINPVTWTALQQNGATKYGIATNAGVTETVTNHKDFSAAKTEGMSITLSGGDWSYVGGTTAMGDASRDLNQTDIAFPGKKVTLRCNLNIKETLTIKDVDVTIKETSIITASEGKELNVKSLNVDGTATVSEGTVITVGKLDNPGAVAGAVNVNGSLTNKGVICNDRKDVVTAVGEIGQMTVTVAANATLTNKGRLGDVNATTAVTVNGHMDNSKGAIWYETAADLTITNSQSWTKGSKDKAAPVKTSATDLTTFTNYKEFTTTGNVTKLIGGADETAGNAYIITFAGGTPDITLEASTYYGTLNFGVDATLTGAATNGSIKEINITGNATLTIAGTVNMVCKTLNKGTSATLDNTVGKLVKSDNATAW